MFKKVQDWKKIDNYGCESTKNFMSINDKRARIVLENTTTLVKGHYQIALLWKQDALIPNSHWRAKKQLQLLNKKLQNNDTVKEKYYKTVQKN